MMASISLEQKVLFSSSVQKGISVRGELTVGSKKLKVKMLVTARPCSTACRPCIPINSSVSILKRPTCCLSAISSKLNTSAERKNRMTPNKIKEAKKAKRKLLSDNYTKLTPDDFEKMKENYLQRYEEINQLSYEIVKETCLPKGDEKVKHTKRRWCIVDASGQYLPMVAMNIAIFLDEAYVIVVCAEHVVVSQNRYLRYAERSDEPEEETFDNLQTRNPEGIIENAVMRILRKEQIGIQFLKNLKFYKGPIQKAPKLMPLLTVDGDMEIKFED